LALLEQEEEVRRVLEKMKLLAKVEVAAAVTQEKCRQLQESRMMQIQVTSIGVTSIGLFMSQCGWWEENIFKL
jgi:hypothetical protein